MHTGSATDPGIGKLGETTRVLKRPGKQRRPTRSLRWLWLVVAAALVGGGLWWGWQFRSSGALGNRSEAVRGQASGQAAPPVHVVRVERQDFPVVLTGLGTVQATNTVTVRSRVDGQIDKVAFQEGQMVKEGDLLIQIDPRPFQAALDQATAKLAQDQANLVNARQDLDRTSTLAKQQIATQQTLDQKTAAVGSLTAQIEADQAAI